MRNAFIFFSCCRAEGYGLSKSTPVPARLRGLGRSEIEGRARERQNVLNDIIGLNFRRFLAHAPDAPGRVIAASGPNPRGGSAEPVPGSRRAALFTRPKPRLRHERASSNIQRSEAAMLLRGPVSLRMIIIENPARGRSARSSWRKSPRLQIGQCEDRRGPDWPRATDRL